MTNLLLKLFDVPSSGNARIAGSELVLSSGVGTVWIILLVIVLAALAVVLYLREQGVVAWKRWTMVALRAALFIMLIMLLARPVLRFTLEGEIRKAILVMIDSSASMSIADPRTEADDQKRAGIAVGTLDPAGGLAQNAPAQGDGKDLSRMDLVRKALTNPKLNLIPRLQKDYDLRAVSFGEQLYDVPIDSNQPFADSLQKIAPDRSATALGDALRAAVTKSRGQPLAGVLLIGDGASNSGSSAIGAADIAAREGVPVYAWGVGITHPKDIAVASVMARDVGFVDDELSAVARIRTSGLKDTKIKVVARLNEKVVGEKTVDIKGDGEEMVQIPVTPKEAGTFNLTVGVDPLPSEAVKDNNSQSQQIKVINDKIKVLYVEQQPRWEYKYLQAVLLRDRRIAAKFVLLDGDKALSEAKDSPFLARVPQEKEELYKFDLILIGDVDPSTFSKSQMDAMEQFVSQFGGAVVMIAGRRYAPQRYTGTPLEKMMPVEWEASPPKMTKAIDKGDTELKFELTPAGKNSEMLRLAEDVDASARIWSKLPPIYWDARVARPKPAAEVLLVDSDPAKASRFGKMPIMATQQYGLGTTMYIGTDNLWRWRKNAGESYHARMWGQIIQRMSLPHLLGESRRTQLAADKKSYAVGDRMTVYARLYTPSYEPVTDQSVQGKLSRKDGQPTTVNLRQVPGQPGMFRGEISGLPAGEYSFSVDSDPKVKLDLPVTSPRIEFADTAMNESLLRSICETSRGAFFREEDLQKLPDSISKQTEKIRSTVDVEIWSSPIFFILMLAFAGTEWAMRKMSYLK